MADAISTANRLIGVQGQGAQMSIYSPNQVPTLVAGCAAPSLETVRERGGERHTHTQTERESERAGERERERGRARETENCIATNARQSAPPCSIHSPNQVPTLVAGCAPPLTREREGESERGREREGERERASERARERVRARERERVCV